MQNNSLNRLMVLQVHQDEIDDEVDIRGRVKGLFRGKIPERIDLACYKFCNFLFDKVLTRE